MRSPLNTMSAIILLAAGLPVVPWLRNAAWAASCGDAARAAERHDGIPTGLLAAIGHIETGGAAGWNWSVNANQGMPGQRFSNPDSAMAYVRGMLGAGHRLIDVGCFQLDLFYHPDAFERWQDAFDTNASAEAAARILLGLHDRTRDWAQAVALYHSADPRRGQPYLRAVVQAWTGGPTPVDRAWLPPMQRDPYNPVSSPSIVRLTVWMPGQEHGWQPASVPDRTSIVPRIITP